MNAVNKYITFILIFFTGMQIGAYNLRQIDSKDGLSNSAILSLSQDDDGLLWIGTCDGLNLYNGLKVLPFRSEAGNIDLSGKLIEHIVNGQDNRLWMRTNYGLHVLDRKTKQGLRFSQYDAEFFLQNNSRDDIVLVRINNEIIYYSKIKNLFYEFPLEDITYSDISNVQIASDDKLNILTKRGLVRTYEITYNANGEPLLTSYTDVNLNRNIEFSHAESNRSNVLYFVDENKVLYEYDLLKKTCQYIFSLKDEADLSKRISSIVKFNNDYFIAFGTGGLIQLLYKPDDFMRYEVKKVDIRSGIFCMLKDKNQDLLWIGTDGQGVFMYTEDAYTIRSYTFSDFMPQFSKPVRSVFLDRDKNLWIGTKGDGIVKIHDYDINKEVSKSKKDLFSLQHGNLNSNSVYSFSKSEKNIIWIGTEEGLCYYSYAQGSIKKINLTENGVDIRHIHSILEVNDSVMWLASVGMGVIKASLSWSGDIPQLLKMEKFTPYNENFGSNHFFSIYKDRDNVLWFANRGHGAFRYDERTNSFSQFSFDKDKKRPTLNDLFSISQNKEGTLLFGTGGGLVNMFRDGRTIVYNEKNDLPNNSIHGILLDSKNTLWLSTNQGVVSFNSDLEVFHVYGQQNGVKVTEFSDGAYYKDSNTNQLFFGGIDGFITINETANTHKEYFPIIQFEDLVIFGKNANMSDYIVETDKGRRLELEHNQNFFTLSFVAIDYIEGTNYSYLYKLEGLSDIWIDNKFANTASFTSIPPGNYSLKVKYVNKVTGKESPEYTLELKIYPPWYKSTIAYVFYNLLMLVLIYAAVWYTLLLNKRKKERMLKRLERIHKEEVHESKINFFTNIAHEFCTPLTLIYGPCSRILSHKGSDAFVTKYTTLIQRNAERLNSLIQELIEFRSIETDNRTPHVEVVDVTELTIHFARNFEDQADSKNIRYLKNIKTSLEWNSDKGFLTTIITNLLSNAFKYTANGGEVGLAVSSDEDFLVITISNTGKGIQDEDLKLVFDRYNILEDFEKQESSDSSRNGLGLAIVAGMVRLLKGTIEVKSEPNVCTDFIVKLPILPLDDISTAENTKYLPELTIRKEYEPIIELPDYIHSANNPTILIIDDDVEVLWLIADIFKDEFNIKTSQGNVTIEDVLTMYSPDIIISDVMLQGVNGIQFTKMMKGNKKTSHIPIILISAKQAMEEQIEGISAGAEMYVTKPFNVEYLKISVNHLINRKAVLQDYFSSPLSAFDLTGGKLTHHEDKKFIQKILDIINVNISNSKLSTHFIASEMNISTRHLYRKLEDIGMQDQSPADMIRESRIHIAKNLLQNTTLTIDEIIYKSGFSNRATFFRLFSSKCNCTPKEYREKSLKDIDPNIE